MKTIARKRKSESSSRIQGREQPRKQPESEALSSLAHPTNFNQIYAPILGLTCSLFNDRLTGRSHIENKPFAEFELLHGTLSQLQKLPSVREDVDLNAAFTLFTSVIPLMFDKAEYAKTGQSNVWIVDQFVEMGLVALNALRLADRKEDFEDLLLAGKMAIIASYFLELAPGVAEKERATVISEAVGRVQKQFNARRIGKQVSIRDTLRTGRQQVHHFMITDFMVKAVGEATEVHETVNDKVKHAYTDAKVGLDKLHRASTRIGLMSESGEKSDGSTTATPTSTPTRGKQRLVKAKRLPQNVRDTLSKVSE